MEYIDFVPFAGQSTNIREGTIVFRVRGGKIDWKDNKRYELFDLLVKGGRLSIVKEGKELKFIHIFEDESVVKANVSKLSNTDHQIAVTWSINRNEISLYIDGKKVASGEMNYRLSYIG